MKFGKIVLKIFVLVFILLTICVTISNNSFAWDATGILGDFENQHAGNAEVKVTNFMGALINVVSTIGAGIAIIMLVVIGIKYVSANASAKADAKNDLPGYVFGAVILFGISGILKILQMFIEKNLN